MMMLIDIVIRDIEYDLVFCI